MRQVQVLGGACLRVGTPCNMSPNARRQTTRNYVLFLWRCLPTCNAIDIGSDRTTHNCRKSTHPKVFFKSAPGSTTKSPFPPLIPRAPRPDELSSLIPYRFRSINRRGGTQTINPEPKYPTKHNHFGILLNHWEVDLAGSHTITVDLSNNTPSLLLNINTNSWCNSLIGQIISH